MLKKVIVFVITTVVFTSIIGCSVRPLTNDTTNVCMNMSGFAGNADGKIESVDIEIKGFFHDSHRESDELDITITLAEHYRYNIGETDSEFTSINQKYNDFPNLFICEGYALDRHGICNPRMVFALDMEKEYFIVLFDDSTKSYVVASQNSIIEHSMLVEHFADFIASYSWQ